MRSQHLFIPLLAVASSSALALTLTLTDQNQTQSCYQLTGSVSIDEQGNIVATASGPCGGVPPDTGPGVFSIGLSQGSVTEGQSATVTISRTGGSSGTASVEIQVDPKSTADASDYSLKCPALTWRNGEAGNRTCTLQTVDDQNVENPETVILNLANALGAEPSTSRTATLTIMDNDTPTTTSCPTPGSNVRQSTLDWNSLGSGQNVPLTAGETVALKFTTTSDPNRWGEIAMGSGTAGFTPNHVTAVISACPGDMTPIDPNCQVSGNSAALGLFYTQGVDVSDFIGFPGCPVGTNQDLFLNLTSDCFPGITCAVVLSIYAY